MQNAQGLSKITFISDDFNQVLGFCPSFVIYCDNFLFQNGDYAADSSLFPHSLQKIKLFAEF